VQRGEPGSEIKLRDLRNLEHLPLEFRPLFMVRCTKGIVPEANGIAVAIMLRTFLWVRSAHPQKCLRPNTCGYSYISDFYRKKKFIDEISNATKPKRWLLHKAASEFFPTVEGILQAWYRNRHSLPPCISGDRLP